MNSSVSEHKDWWPSPAKLNLFLHILGRYDNGYHQLQSLFQMLDYGDALAFDISTDDTAIRMETPLDGVPDDDNLIVKAARLLATKTKCDKGAVISLDKRLPMGGGIGGAARDTGGRTKSADIGACAAEQCRAKGRGYHTL